MLDFDLDGTCQKEFSKLLRNHKKKLYVWYVKGTAAIIANSEYLKINVMAVNAKKNVIRQMSIPQVFV